MRTGLDRLLADPARLAGRSFGLLTHAPAVSEALQPAHLALARCGYPPLRLLAPEHGLYAVEQDMVASRSGRDPWTGIEIVSLYGSEPSSLVPGDESLAGLDLLVIDVVDIGTRYYTFGTSACWAAREAVRRGLEVWILDRPNPLGGLQVEGPGVAPSIRSFVGAFELPVRHGLTLGELVLWAARSEGWPVEAVQVFPAEGWDRSVDWRGIGRPWLAPSPNMPSFETALLYPGLCLLEATTLSEGRGTTRPFRLLGAPGLDGPALARRLEPLRRWGVGVSPARFRPQFQKHAGEVCEGVELSILEADLVRGFRVGVELLWALREWRSCWGWRQEPYEFVADVPALDLLAGSSELREALERDDRQALDRWIESWSVFEATFLEERRALLRYGASAP